MSRLCGLSVFVLGLVAIGTLGVDPARGDREAPPAKVLGVVATDSAGAAPGGNGLDESTEKQATQALDLSLRWLAIQQHQDGSWAQGMYPAITGLAVTVYGLDPRREADEPMPLGAQRGIDFLLRCVQPDGGIYAPGDSASTLPCYNTAVALTALSVTGNPRYRTVIANARAFLIRRQHHGTGVSGGGFSDSRPADPNDLGDLATTSVVLHALRLSDEALAGAADLGSQAELDRALARRFLARMQNVPGTNDQPWAARPSAADEGGFVPGPAARTAGEAKGAADRSDSPHAGVSYAGLLDLLDLGVDRQDPAVQKGVGWLGRHYTVERTPDMEVQGLYRTYYNLSQALRAWGGDLSSRESGHAAAPPPPSARWRTELARKLIALQRVDPQARTGYWTSSDARWWENDPVPASCLAILALETCMGSAAKQ